MKGFVGSIEKAAIKNKTFRTVLYTAKNCQLVVMSLKPGEDIGAEVHQLDQLLRVEEGEGKAVLDGVEHKIKPGFAILVPAGARHNIINGPSGPMKLYTLYAPPNPASGWTAFIRVAHYFFNESRISVRSFTSAVGSGGGAGGSSFFSLLIALIAKNKTPAMIRKFKATIRN